MKKLRKLFVIFAIMLMSAGGIMFGCADKYKNMTIETDLNSNEIELFLGEDLLESQPSTLTFNVSVSGVSDDVSTNVKYNLNGNDIVTISLQKEDGNKTAVTLTALNLGQTTLKLLTEEGGKTCDVSVKVTNPLKRIEKNTESGYKPYAVVGQTTVIRTPSAISFYPSSTTQKGVEYTMAAPYQGITLFGDGTILADETAENGSFFVNVQSTDNNSIRLEEPLQVFVLRPIEDITIMHGDVELDNNDELRFATNMEEEKHKSLTLSATPNDYPYTLNVEMLDSSGNASTNNFSATLVNQTLTEDLYIISAMADGVAYFKITASINGFEYVSQPKTIKLVAVEVPSSIQVLSKYNEDEIVVYDSYKNNYGEQIYVNIGSVNASNRNFAIRIAKNDAEKIQFFTGKRDSAGNLVPVNFNLDTDDEYVISTDVLQTGSSLYVVADSTKLITNVVSRVDARFIALGSVGLLGAPVYKDITFALRKGVTYLSLENNLVTNELLVPIKLSNDEEGVKLVIGTNASQHTRTIFTTFEDSGLLLDSTEVSYEDSVVDGDTRLYTFTLWGAKEGVYTLTFYSQNGIFRDVRVRVFTKVTDITLTTTTIQQNSNIAEINYTKTDNDLTTLDAGSLTIRNGSYVNLFINTYNNSLLQNSSFKGYPKYTYDTKIIVIDAANRIHAIKVGQTSVTLTIEVYDSDAEDNVKEFEINFIVKVEELLQNISLNSRNITIYEKSTLSDYVDETGLSNKQRYGEFTFELNVTPNSAQLKNLVIIPSWTGDAASLNTSIEEEYDDETKIYTSYKVKIWCDKIDGFKDEAKVKFTISVSQYQRTLVKQASINILKAEKVKQLFNVKKVQDNTSILISKRANVMPKVNLSGNLVNNEYESEEYPYLYFDSRNMKRGTSFALDCDIMPETALNKNLVILIEEFAGYPNVLSIKNNILTIQNAGVTKIYICTQDSFDTSKGSGLQSDVTCYNDPVVIVVKVADGETRHTALEVSSASDLISINNNIESLSKHYIVTQDITVPYGDWTPIGYINGIVHEFTGSFNGLISSTYNQKVVASISGLNFKRNSDVDSNNHLGLFAILGSSAVIENVDLQISSVTVEQENESLSTYFGGAASKNFGIVQNVHINYINSGKIFETDANIADYSNELYLGGIVGKNESGGQVYNCYAGGYINVEILIRNSKYNVGGLVGLNDGTINGNTEFFNVTEFNDEYNSDMNIIVNQTLGTDKDIGVGGIAGFSSNEIKNASFAGYISASNRVGGIVGASTGKISYAFSSGYLVGKQNVGGIAGYIAGTETKHAELKNSSVNMFDDGNLNACIVGKANVGGLIGYAQYTSIENAYARSYKNPSKDGLVGDIYVLNDTLSQTDCNVGGVIGMAENCNFKKVYARLSLNTSNATTGGLVGYASSLILENTYERNNLLNETVLQGLIIGQNSTAVGADSSSDYFYGIHLETPLCGTEGKLVSSTNTNKLGDNRDFSDWQSAGVLTANNNEPTYGKNSWNASHNWYLPYNETYPHIIFGSKEVLTIEAPTKIELSKKTDDEWLNKLFIKLENVYVQNGDEHEAINNAYVLFKNGNSTYKFSELFDINVLPDDQILNVSKSYRIVSSDENVIQVSGKTNANYKLKPVSEGKTIITIISNLNAEVRQEIVVYVVNVVKNFEIRSENHNLIIGASEELKSSVAANFVNNNNFLIKFSKEDALQQVYLNDPQKIGELTYTFQSNEKVFIGAKKSGSYKLTYQLLFELELVDEYGNKLQLDLPNVKGKNVIVYGDELDPYTFVYGIDEFVCDTSMLQTGLNDGANIVYTLTGDDLRYITNDSKTLPKINLSFEDDENKEAWNLQLIKANVYSSLEQTEPNIVYFAYDSSLESSIYVCDGRNYRLDGTYDFNDTIVKIEYVFRIVINSSAAESYFKANTTDDSIESKADSIKSNLRCTAQISDISDSLSIYADKFQRTVPNCELSIVRQKVDTVLIDYFANAEKTVDENNNEVYEINEMPSDGIIAGVEGILKIYIGPQNAEVNEIEISYSSASYNLSMRQMLKYVSKSDEQETSYIQRKPYAIAINNGKGLSLYKESNYEENESSEPVYAYDGYIYVACLIPSSVPANQKFAIDVTVTFNNQYKLTRHKELISKLASQISIRYKLKDQVLDSFAYIAENTENEFYVDFTEIVEAEDRDNLESKFAPNGIFTVDANGAPSSSYKIELVEIKEQALKQTYRVYYKLTTSVDLTLQITMQKADNNIITNIQSNQFTFKCVPFVVDSINIKHGDNNTLSIKQSSPSKLNANLELIYDEKLKDSENAEDIAKYNKIIRAKASLEEKISNNICYWFGMKQDSMYLYETLSGDAEYTNYRVIQTGNSFTIGVKQINTTATIYVEVAFDYEKEVVEPFNYDGILSNKISSYINENRIGLYNKGNYDYPEYVHYLRNSVNLNLTNDVSDEFAIPVRNQEEFDAMIGGVDQIAYYALDNDIELVNYTPRALSNISFNGNMHTINIKNFNIVESVDGDSVTYRSSYGLFSNIDENSVVKNLNVNYSGLVNIEDRSSEEYDKDYYNLYNGVYNTENSDDSDRAKFTELLSNNHLLYTTGFAASNINFGGVAAENYGVIFNVSVTSKEANLVKGNADTKTGRRIVISDEQIEYVDYCEFVNSNNSILSFTNSIASSVQIGGIAANNSGYISYSQSNVPFVTNCGTIAGLVAVNSKKISNSKVVLNGEIKNTLTTSANAVTGGFVARNSGEIFGCYVSSYLDDNIEKIAFGSTSTANNAKIIANSTVGGFVNNNTGSIKNCYSNVEVVSSLRSSGFVFNNSGDIESCYSSSKIEESSSAHSPFTGRGATGEFQNTGTIEDCYYIGTNSTYENIEPATQVAYEADSSNNNIQKYHFAKFVFATNKNSYDGNWIWTKVDDYVSIPRLIDANLNIYSCEKYCGVSTDSNNPYYSWEFLVAPENTDEYTISESEKATIYDNPIFGQKSTLENSNRINPRVIYNLKTWQEYLKGGTDSTLSDYFVIVKDITASNLTAPNTSVLTFSGTMFGSNMNISNLYLAADDSNRHQSFGLFKEVSGIENKKALVKDLNLSVKKALANNINCVGVFAGYVNRANIININIDAESVVVQGKTMVGALAGIINNSTVKKINIIANVNAGRKLYENEMYNYLDSDLKTLTVDGENDEGIKYSYAGGFAGAIVGTSDVKLISITGNSVVIGYYVGSVAGLVGQDSHLTYASTKVEMNQYVRGYYIAGGLVGENRGTVDRCFIENVEQQAIDANKDNKYVTNRNTTFFDEKISYSKIIGGLVGFNNGGKVLNSYSKIDVRSTNYTTKTSGGLIGIDVGGEINCCYATGSVINRYSIGGIIGVVTNKFFLLGYGQATSQNAHPSRVDSDNFFATNYNEDNTLNTSTVGAYIYTCSNEIKSDGSISLEDKGKADLLIKNTLASNKWIVNSDETYLSYTTGMFIGNILAKGEPVEDCFSEEMLYLKPDTSIKTFKALFNNYVNSQILKDESSLITPSNIKLNNVIKYIIDPVGEFQISEPAAILKGLKEHTINLISDRISGSGSGKDHIIAEFEINNGVLVSFQNILNIDNLLFHSGEYKGRPISDQNEFESMRDNLYVWDGETYVKANKYFETLVFDYEYDNTECRNEWNRLINAGLYSAENTDSRLATNANYWVETNETDTEIKYYINSDKKYTQYNGVLSEILYIDDSIDSYNSFERNKDLLWYKVSDNNFREVKANNIEYYTQITSPDDIETYNTVYIDVDGNPANYCQVLKSNLVLQENYGEPYDEVYIQIQISNTQQFTALRARLYIRNVEGYIEVANNDSFDSNNNYYLKFKENNSSIFYRLTHNEYYKMSSLYRKNYTSLYYIPQFFVETTSLFEGYDKSYFILPDSEISSTRFYPEIIVNVNLPHMIRFDEELTETVLNNRNLFIKYPDKDMYFNLKDITIKNNEGNANYYTDGTDKYIEVKVESFGMFEALKNLLYIKGESSAIQKVETFDAISSMLSSQKLYIKYSDSNFTLYKVGNVSE